MQRIVETLDENYVKFEDEEIIVIIDNDKKTWFCGNHISIALEYINPKAAIQGNVDKDDKIKLENINTDLKIDLHPHSIFINESGLFSLILASKMPKAKKFKRWITSEVLPSITEFGYYKLKEKMENEKNDILKQVKFLKKQNENMKNDLKNEKVYPDGLLVYVLDYSDEYDFEDNNVYRIGETDNMKTRKRIYDTHMLHKKEVVYKKVVDNPLQFETCLRALLYNFRYKNKKDFYICDKSDIKKAFTKCSFSINSMNQKGGGSLLLDDKIEILNKKINKYDHDIDKINIKIEMLNDGK
jgi:prophage antirepressor-like protein